MTWHKTSTGYVSSCGRAIITRRETLVRSRKTSRTRSTYRREVRWDGTVDGRPVPVCGRKLGKLQTAMARRLTP